MELENIELKKYSLEERVGDAFVCGCYTGLRISDLKRVSRQHIKNINGEKYVEIEMKKTEKPVTIPLTEKLGAFSKSMISPGALL